MSVFDYQLGSVVGTGAFGKNLVYTPCCLISFRPGVVREAQGSDGQLVIKLERKSKKSRIPREYFIYSKLRGVTGIPQVLDFKERGKYYALLMENSGMDFKRFFHFSEFWDIKITRCLVSYFAYEMVCRTFILI